jgi:hypothetical protein
VTEKPLAQSLSIICLSCLNDSHWIRHGAVFDGTKKNGVNLVIHQLNSFVACSGVFAHFYGICALIKRRANQQVQASNLSGYEIASLIWIYRVYWNFRSDLTLRNTDDVRTNHKKEN